MESNDYLDEALRVLIPEEHDEEHGLGSEVIHGHRHNLGLQERFKPLFFLLSNNFRLIERSEPSHLWEEPDNTSKVLYS